MKIDSNARAPTAGKMPSLFFGKDGYLYVRTSTTKHSDRSHDRKTKELVMGQGANPKYFGYRDHFFVTPRGKSGCEIRILQRETKKNVKVGVLCHPLFDSEKVRVKLEPVLDKKGDAEYVNDIEDVKGFLDLLADATERAWRFDPERANQFRVQLQEAKLNLDSAITTIRTVESLEKQGGYDAE